MSARWGALVFLATFLSMVFIPATSAAALDYYRFHGGIKNEKDYAEVLYITGEPVILRGTIQESFGQARDGRITGRVTYRLGNTDKGITLTRTVSFVTSVEKNGRQEVNTTTVDRFSETITVGKNRYALQDFQFSRSDLIDHQPAVDYKSGNWSARKVYSLNNGQATVVVETWGDTVGYNHAWGSTETAREEGTVSFSGKVALDKTNLVATSWNCSFSQGVSYHRTRYLEYQANEPQNISFAGGYVENSRTTETLQYQGSFPDLDNGVLASTKLIKREGDCELQGLADKNRLWVAQLADVRGHWAEGDIRQMYGLGAFEETGDYFYPTLPFYRGQFARALVAVLDLPLPVEDTGGSRLAAGPPAVRSLAGTSGLAGRTPQTSQAQEKPLFTDVAVTDPAYKYYRAVYEAGVMTGTGPGLFNPTRPLTRAEALVILVRALGLEGRGPAGYVTTSFMDDAEIPSWARPAIYVAEKIGLARGDEYGFLKPNEVLSRAEAAVFLNRFVRYLQEEMTADYRERLLGFN
ncbi:S-layer homology domain-containing protein [Neomoorella humiferrea]|uniref:Endoglucanase n=1 Tax=Neomoorella humiferrea TaxID=676965 RepID=A0A2T0ANB6_9FIRM|nr:S-layer homology domain-containing protein [Moorella humiferrea]PRR70304.1 Endoglucanase precursor [Moorella humiferrea]